MILFKPEHVPMILEGRKTQTRRLGKKRWNVGSVHACYTRPPFAKGGAVPFCRVGIADVCEQPLLHMTPEDALAEGYATLAEYRDVFCQIYGEDAYRRYHLPPAVGRELRGGVMSDATKIEWADATWNPMTGCTPVSEACEHCYALRMLGRNLPNHSGPLPTFHPERLDAPLHWRKPRRVFVCSMSDLFHEAFTDEQVREVFWTMQRSAWHTYMVLTKRPDRMRTFLDGAPVLSHIWLGVTVENQQRADERIPILLDTPAAVRFVSIEPMLGPVDLSGPALNLSPDGEPLFYVPPREHVDWVIVGGETGPGARPMQPEWALDVYWQCKATGVPFFFKKWGKAAPDDLLWRAVNETGDPHDMTYTRNFPRGAL